MGMKLSAEHLLQMEREDYEQLLKDYAELKVKYNNQKELLNLYRANTRNGEVLTH